MLTDLNLETQKDFQRLIPKVIHLEIHLEILKLIQKDSRRHLNLMMGFHLDFH